MPSINFHSAARRHYDDAELLLENTREANAGHLYGFVAECGIKALLVASGLPSDPAGDIPQNNQFRRHADQLANDVNSIQLFVQNRSGAKYSAQVSQIVAFSDWSTNHRYYDDSALPSSTAKWRSAAHQVMMMLDQAKFDGVIP